MKTLKAAILFVLLTTIALTAFCTTSQAITGNYNLDQTPYVGLVVLFSDAERTQPISFSTGILISPTVVLTAGHCVTGGIAVSVCFDQEPITYAIDESGKTVYTIHQPIYDGVPLPYQRFTDSLETGIKSSKVLQTSDVGLIILSKPVKEVTNFPSLPTEGLADTLTVNTALQVIGYGVQYQTTPKDQHLNTWSGSVVRNSATVNLLSTNFQGSSNYLSCTANAAQDKGGVAYGDSGGPVLYTDNGQSIVLAVNAYVNNGNCAGITYHTRIDNPQVLKWISGYI